jgi:Tfp pilus assembly protein FimT
MKKLLIIIAILSIATPCFAGPEIFLSAGGAAACSTYPCADATHDGCGNTVLLCEDFQSDQACGDGSHTNCRVAWTSWGTTTTDFNNQLDSSNSALLTNTGYAGQRRSFTAGSPRYAFAKINLGSMGAGGSVGLMQFTDNPVTAGLCGVGITPDSAKFALYNGTSWATCSTGCTTATTGTTYYVWMEYTKGGATSTCTVYIAPQVTPNMIPSKPGSPEMTNSDGTKTADAGIIDIFNSGDATENNNVYDNIRIGSSAL